MRNLQAIIPGSRRLNRGKMSILSLGEVASSIGARYVLVCARRSGNPGSLEFYEVLDRGLRMTPPTIRIGSARLQREYGISRRRIRVRGEQVGILSSPESSNQRLAEALSKILGFPVIPSLEKLDNIKVYMRILSGDNFAPRITFFLRGNGVEEVGPSISISGVDWDVGQQQAR